MQPVLVMLLMAWLLGILVGAAFGSVFWLLLAVAGMVAATQTFDSKIALTGVVVVLVSLGFVYGDGSGSVRMSDCPLLDPAQVRIVARPDVRESSVRYLVEDERGCDYFVYTERWPVYERETVVRLVGGTWRDYEAVQAENSEFGNYLVRHQVAGMWTYPRIEPLSIVAADETYRATLSRVHKLFPEPDASLIGAMMFADRGQLPQETVEYFRRTSLTHILSISGAHISLLAGMLFAVSSLVPIRPRIRTLIIILLLWGYVWFVGAPVAAVRAGFFWSVTLVALRLGLLVSLPTALMLTLTSMLTWNPLLILDIGLQLSFLAVLGIFLALFMTKPWRSRLAQVGSPTLVTAIIVSAGASALTWPLISYYFGVISLSAVVANLFILPAVPVIMSGSVFVIGVSWLSDLAAALIVLPVHGAIVWMFFVARALGTLPGTWLEYTVSGWTLPVYYGGLGILLAVTMSLQQRSWREVWE